MIEEEIFMADKTTEIKIKVFRFDPALDESPRMEEYPVEYHEGMTMSRKGSPQGFP